MTQTDGDSSPTRKHPTSVEMPSADLLNYQLKELRDGQSEQRRHNATTTAVLQRIETALRDGSMTMADHDRQLKAIKAAALKASASLITGVTLVAWEFIKHLFLKDPK